MRTPRQLTAALGAGFYRYWHVPAPDAALDARDTRRADLSVIGPVALAVLAVSAWAAGRVGTSLLLDEGVTMPIAALPWTARLLVLTGVLGLAVAGLWWLGTAGLRARVARAVARGDVARIPDDPATASEPLHAAATHLGRTLRALPDPPPLADPAFEVLRTATCVLTSDSARADERRRLRRRCLALAHRLEGAAGHGTDAGPREPAAA